MKRKKWEPKYRFGGNPANGYLPAPLGENQDTWKAKIKKTKRK